MSKPLYNKNIILTVLIVMVCVPAALNAAEAEKVTGKENPFEIVKPGQLQKSQIESVTAEGITKEQLRQAISAALKENSSSGESKTNDTPVPIVIPDRYMQSLMLKFLQAANVQPVVSSMLSQHGMVAIDAETNTIIVCDTKESLEKIAAEIRKADQTPQQVLVEVVILDVQLSDSKELGVNWDNLFESNGSFLGSVSYTQQLNDLTTGGSLTLIRGRVESTIKALQKERNTEILATPRVLVVSGQQASFETIEEIPYTDLTQTGSGGGIDNPIASTDFKNAGITLTVKPTVTDEGKIKIEVEPDQSINTGVAGVGNTNVPIIDRRRVKTTLLMNEGEIAVIGGLRSKDVRITQDKIPLLGDIPFIGGLFSNDKEVVENSELLILISPHIYSEKDHLAKSEKDVLKEAKSLKPVRLRKKIRPEAKVIKNIVPQNKPE